MVVSVCDCLDLRSIKKVEVDKDQIKQILSTEDPVDCCIKLKPFDQFVNYI